MVEWSFDTRDAQAARNARREFVNRMHSWYGDVANDSAAELVLGELIGNAARYAPGLARVRADFDEAGVTIAVHDCGAGFFMSCDRSVDLLDESGRGLAIVAQFARKHRRRLRYRHRLLRSSSARHRSVKLPRLGAKPEASLS